MSVQEEPSMRRNVGGKLEFIGVNTTTDKHSLSSGYAIRAEEVFIRSGRVQSRLGRKELSEDQLNPQRPLGLFPYATVNGNQSMVIVRLDGIYQRR